MDDGVELVGKASVEGQSASTATAEKPFSSISRRVNPGPLGVELVAAVKRLAQEDEPGVADEVDEGS